MSNNWLLDAVHTDSIKQEAFLLFKCPHVCNACSEINRGVISVVFSCYTLAMDSIRLILWKNVRLRLHHPLLTILEICFPIFVFHQGILFYNAFQKHADNGTLYPVLQEQELYQMFKSSFLIIAYAPETSFTSDIMEKTMHVFGRSIFVIPKSYQSFVYLYLFHT